MIQAARLWDVVEEHLDDAAFLWDQWERALASPVRFPAEVAAHLESHLRANLDGLLVACPEAIDRLLLPALRSPELGRVAAAAVVLAELPGGLQHLADALREGVIDAGEPVARALGLAARADLEAELLAALGKADGPLTLAALNALAFRRVDPGAALPGFLRSADPALQAAALRAARSSRQAVRGAVETACASPHPAVRDAAILTGLRLGFRAPYTACQKLLQGTPPAPELLHQVLAMSGDPADLPRLEAGLDQAATRPTALVALGYAGWPGSMERIIACAGEPELAPLAGEAFAAIAGVAIDGPFLAMEEEDAEPPDLDDDELEADLAGGPAADLSVPDVDCLRSWWGTRAAEFNASVRHLAGRPAAPEQLHGAFLGACTRRRQGMGLELAIRSHGQWDIELRGWAAAQLLAERAPLRLASDMKLPFSRLLQS